MLRLHQGNRLERLAEDLFARLLEPSGSPLEPEWVVVPQPGIARWLSLGLARRRGIAANVRFPLPAAFIWHLLRAALPDVPERSRFEPGVLKWQVLAALGDPGLSEGTGDLEHYLAGADERMRHELAGRIAGCFDQYLVFRPDWIRGWERGEETHWQARLWRRLAGGGDPGHWVALCERFLAALSAGAAPPAGLPPRAFLFAVTSLSPAYVEILAALAEHVEVHAYVLDPCREYWGDIVTPREVARRGIAEPERLYFTRGHPLLAAFGRVGRELIDQLQESGSQTDEHYAPVPGDTLLARLQNDVLDLRDRSAPPGERTVLAPGDRSVQVHVCHGPVREMEVLHDQLLALFEDAGDLDPSDVAVLTPSIETYAPAIEAVFGSAPPERRIPYAVADRRPASESPLVAAFFKLLDLPGGRFPADEVFGLLGHAALRRRFRIDAAALARLRAWVDAAGIRWGIDAASRGRLGLPATDEFSWRHGLDRLLLGLALQGEHRRALGGVHPVDGIDPGDAELLGRFVEFCERVFALGPRLERPRPAGEWAELLAALAADFLDPRGIEVQEVQLLLGAVAGLAADCELAGHREPLGIAVVRAHLLGALPTLPGGRGGGLLSGRLTFCEMVPMRSIPFAVVCLVGMNDGTYPRRVRRLGFDRLAGSWRRGDRDPRDEDRYLFLESLLAARRCLYLSYTGFDPREDAALPPATVVAELLDHLERGFAGSDGRGGADAVTTRHPLQPFSPRYFEPGSGLFTYDAASARAAAALSVPGRAGPGASPATALALGAFFASPLAPAGAEWREVGVDAFVRFFEHPVRYLLHERLGVRLAEGGDALGAPEPFALEGLERYRLRHLLLPLVRAGRPFPEVLAVVRGDARLPAGRMGEIELSAALAEVRDFEARLEAAGAGAWPAGGGGCEVDLTLALAGGRGSLRVSGILDGVYGPARLVSGRLGRQRPRDLVTAWVRHLIASTVLDAPASDLVYLGGGNRLAPVADPGVHLGDLAEVYWDGLHAPARLLPAAGLAHLGPGRREAADREAADPYHVLAFEELDPRDAELVRLSERLLRPLLEHLGPARAPGEAGR